MRRKAMSLILGVMVLAAMSGCARQPAAPALEDTLIIGSSQEPTTLDPAIVYDGSDRITRLIYESLLDYVGSTAEVQAHLATDWRVSPDGKVYTFELRDDVQFHDGTPFNAEAVKFSFDRMTKIAKGMSWAFRMVLAEVKVTAEYTVEFHLKKPYPGFLGMVANRYAAPIISPSIMQHEKDGDLAQGWAHDNAIGTGPYKLVNWTKKQELTLVKNDDYWRGWPQKHISRVVYKILPDSATQRMMLERGDIHTATHIGIDDIIVLMDHPEIRIEPAPTSNFNWFLLLNTQKGVFADRRLREALSWAFPYDETVRHVFRGQATQSVGPVPFGVPGHEPDLFQYHRDLDRAKALMAAAGYPNGGFKVTITHGDNDWARKILEMTISTLGELGITAETKPLVWGAMLDNMASQDTAPDIVVADWWDDYPDPDAFLGGMADAFWWGGREAADYFYVNPEVQDLLGEAAFEADPARRVDLYRRAQELMVADCPGVWIMDYLYATPFRKNVYGYVANPYYIMSYNVYGMWIEAR
ncbi:MAG: ABC transporter substrate-binding protein [bacterium]|nr:ABC transporter substrate-binding protein [bacterium]